MGFFGFFWVGFLMPTLTTCCVSIYKHKNQIIFSLFSYSEKPSFYERSFNTKNAKWDLDWWGPRKNTWSWSYPPHSNASARSLGHWSSVERGTALTWPRTCIYSPNMYSPILFLYKLVIAMILPNINVEGKIKIIIFYSILLLLVGWVRRLYWPWWTRRLTRRRAWSPWTETRQCAFPSWHAWRRPKLLLRFTWFTYFFISFSLLKHILRLLLVFLFTILRSQLSKPTILRKKGKFYWTAEPIIGYLDLIK